MSKQNKWAGNYGKVASGGSSTGGGNVYKPVARPSAPKSSSSKADNVITRRFTPGNNFGAGTISSHNSINTFTRGIKSRGPYGGPSFGSFNSSKLNMQRSDTSSISNFKTPSGGTSSRGTVGGSGRGLTSNSKTGSGQAKTSPMARAASNNKNGSGRQNLA